LRSNLSIYWHSLQAEPKSTPSAISDGKTGLLGRGGNVG
jgi:hypothetical protein